jgi:hypothetical protein
MNSSLGSKGWDATSYMESQTVKLHKRVRHGSALYPVWMMFGVQLQVIQSSSFWGNLRVMLPKTHHSLLVLVCPTLCSTFKSVSIFDFPLPG